MKNFFLLLSLISLCFLFSCKGSSNEDTFQTGEVSYSSNGSSEYMRAKELLLDEKIVSAYKIYKNLILEEPENVDILKDLGIIEYGLKKYDESIKYYTKAAEISPNDGEIYYRLGNVYYRIGDNDKYMENYRKSADCGYQPVIDWFAAKESDDASNNLNNNSVANTSSNISADQNFDNKSQEEKASSNKSIIDEYE